MKDNNKKNNAFFYKSLIILTFFIINLCIPINIKRFNKYSKLRNFIKLNFKVGNQYCKRILIL